MRAITPFAVALVLALPASGVTAGQPPPPIPATPILVLDAEKGLIEIRLFRSEAPKSVEHIVRLVRQNFYRGLRFHRVESMLVQIGDPQSRRMTLQAQWGTQNSGTPINVAEISKTRRHVRGTVGLAYASTPEAADSQFYIMKGASPSLDGRYAIIGEVIAGMAVVDRLAKTDLLRNAYLKGEGRTP